MTKPSIAKITRPRLAKAFPRKRLFRLLDGERDRAAVWVAAPAGSGKTTLVASWLDARKLPCLWYQVDAGDGDLASFFYYMGQAAKKAAPRHRKELPLLTPEYLQAVPLFTKRYFEQLFPRLKLPAAIVFDNCQDAPQESGFHEMLAHALESVPEGITVVILSRNRPPQQFARLQANNKLQVLGWEDIRFTLQETETLIKIGERTRLSAESLGLLHKKTEGWAAGLVLLIAGKNFGALGENFPGGFDPANVFDYFASEIFEKTDETVRSFLLKTSFLSRVDAGIAGHLTGNSSAAQILDRLSRDHYFTYRHRDEGAVYQYHPLFREFLQARAESFFSPAESNAIRVRAALIMADSGHTDEAIDHLLLAGRWDEAAGLIMENAHAVTAQGRNKTLEGWIGRLPAERVAQEPWLSYRLALCRMLFNPAGARLLLEKAFAQFSERDDAKGLYLSWAGIIDTFYLAWNEFGPLANRWIPEFEALSRRHPDFPSLEMEARVKLGFFTALFWGKPRHPDLPKIVERLTQIMLNSSDHSLRFVIGSNLVLYHTWTGPAAKAKFIFDLLQPAARRFDADPLALHLWFGTTAMYAWLSAEHDVCASNIAQAVALGEKTGVRPFEQMLCGQGVCSALSQGDLATAESFVARIAALDSPRKLDRSYYHNVAATVAWQRGDWKGAVEHGEQGLRSAEESEAPLSISLALLDLAITWFDMGRIKEAEEGCARALAESAGLTLVEFVCSLFQAWFALEQGGETRGIVLLRQALAIGAKQGFVNYPRWRSGMMSRICAIALERGIEPEYAGRLITLRKLQPPVDAGLSLDAWPWPIRIHALGTFGIELNGGPLTFSGKVQKKPLELLKALIAFGGEGVPEERISEALWPDADGDLAHKSVENNLSRLRRLLGNDQAIVYREGRLSIDRQFCWIDAREFENAVKSAERCVRGPRSKEQKRKSAILLSLLEKAVVLYRGKFLEGEDGLAWAAARREELMLKCFKALERLAEQCRREGNTRQALEYYRRGMEIDPLAEESYRNAMLCYQKLGREAEAVRVYRRCREALLAGLGAEPSSITRDLYLQLSAK